MNNKVKKCVGKEAFSRMNYLYQLATTVEDPETSRAYSELIIRIMKKSVQRLDPSIKRKICKGCNKLLVPGDTCTVRIRRNIVKWTCLTCKSTKRFPLNKHKELWIDRPEAQIELLDYSKNVNI